MSEAIAFDTHRFVKRLTDNGFTETQAEALADEQVSLLNSNLATKQNLMELKGDLERQMAELKGDLERKIVESKNELLKWIMGAMVAQTGVIVGLVVGLM